MSKEIDLILTSLSSKQKLERDKALVDLMNVFADYDPSMVDCLFSSFINATKKSDGSWESYHGIFSAIKSILNHKDCPASDLHLLKEIREAAIKFLTHSEVRVRDVAGEVLGALCSRDECASYIECKEQVLHLIKTNMERDPNSLDENSSSDEPINGSNPSKERRNSSDAAQIFHDTAGWRNLETSMKCLESMIIGCGNNFLPFINHELLELLFTTLRHTNRFVRETGFTVCAALVSCGMPDNEEIAQNNPLISHGDQLSEHLAKGLADNWSQVRLSASVAARKFLLTLPQFARERFFPVLLPRICLNRYYVAEGVRLYSQETWRQVTGNEGRVLVEKFIDDVVPYYVEATEADNHAVREAACACIAELAQKIPQAAVRPHVTNLLAALTVCFNDDSWPVRDAACLACGNFISFFPEESSSELETLFPLFFTNLQDNIPSVRQGAASALFHVVNAHTEESFPKIRDFITEAFEGVANQTSEVTKYGNLETGPATFSVAKSKRDNDMDLHSNKQMYSCGSLAPKMGRGGCSDCRFRRPPQPWEKADGCIYLMGGLSSIASLNNDVSKLLPLMASACRHKHYTGHIVMLETMCKLLPVICKGLGKKPFKTNLSLFLDSIFYALQSEVSLTSSAASHCLNLLSQILGPNIIRGRVEEHNPSYLKALDANSFIAPL